MGTRGSSRKPLPCLLCTYTHIVRAEPPPGIDPPGVGHRLELGRSVQRGAGLAEMVAPAVPVADKEARPLDARRRVTVVVNDFYPAATLAWL